MAGDALVKRGTAGTAARRAAPVALPSMVVAGAVLASLPVEHALVGFTHASATTISESGAMGLAAGTAAVAIAEGALLWKRDEIGSTWLAGAVSVGALLGGGAATSELIAHQATGGLLIGGLGGAFVTGVAMAAGSDIMRTRDPDGAAPMVRRMALPGSVVGLGLTAAIVAGHLLHAPIPDPGLIGDIAVGGAAAAVAPIAAIGVHAARTRARRVADRGVTE